MIPLARFATGRGGSVRVFFFIQEEDDSLQFIRVKYNLSRPFFGPNP
jgi:hypothetical protein